MHHCHGQAAISLLFFLFAGALFALPFARKPDAPAWGREDLTRNTGIARDFTLEQDITYAGEVIDAGFAGELRTLVEESSETYFGMRSDWLIDRGILEIDRLPAGRRAYETECSGCHGRIGDGAGPAATFLHPRPRNFRKGAYKFTTTSTGMRPKRSDLFGTITRGLAGSAMPSFRLLNEERRHDIVEYVRFLGMKGEFEHMLVTIATDEEELPDPEEYANLVADRWDPDKLISTFPGAPETPRTAESIARGRELYFDHSRANCVSCHGSEGKGDGAAVTGSMEVTNGFGEDVTVEGIYDDWGYRMFPRDFSSGVFRAGQEGKDLYITVATGIGGTPMGSFSGVLSPEEIWDLIHFVQSLGEGGGQ
ncbi:MAG: cytochrome c [Planctomycetes bacterium]|nr:cytochrome c [Planctomycetota bacterium]MCB9904426.1 cytochrome c [Planctomycetota bacterium]